MPCKVDMYVFSGDRYMTYIRGTICKLHKDNIQLATPIASYRSVIYHLKDVYIDCVGTYIDFVETIYLLRKETMF